MGSPARAKYVSDGAAHRYCCETIVGKCATPFSGVAHFCESSPEGGEICQRWVQPIAIMAKKYFCFIHSLLNNYYL